MSSRPRTKLRLVKCPKCAKILPEPEQVRVYACGGCNTILQAKYYTSDRGPNLREDEFDGSSHRSSCSGQQSLDEDEKRDRNLVQFNPSMRESMYSAYSNLSDESTFLDNEENSTSSEPRVLVNEEPEKFCAVNEAKEDEVDQIQQSDDITSDKHEHFRQVSMLDESISTQNKDDEKGGNGSVEFITEKLEGIDLRDKDSTVSLEIGTIDSVSVSRVAQREPLDNVLETNRHDFPSRVPPLYQNSEVTYETGSSSSFVQDELPGHHNTRHHPYVYDDNPHFQRGDAGGTRRRFSESIYYNYETSPEIYQRSNHYYHSCDDRKRRSESWCPTQRIPYSSELLKERYQIPDPYNNHRYPYPNDLRWSGQLPINGLCCHQGEIGWVDPYEYLSYPRDQNSIYFPDDQRYYKDQIMRRLHLREKKQAVKRHLVPSAGGAPFVTCYFCFRILRLPPDFLLPARRRKTKTHLLKCGSCSNILEFFLENECCLVTCAANNDSGETQTDVGRHSNFTKEEGKVSERGKTKPVSGNEDRMHKSEDEGDECSSVENGRQMKVTWELPARTKSPLHCLMGYSSPRDLLMESDEDADI